jgi:TolA-binding protein
MGSGEQGEALFKRAGLNLMRVVSYYPDSPEAPTALLLAGQINEKLGNANAARRAYEKVTTTYRDSDSAKKAAELLAAMQKPAGQPAGAQP